MRLPIVIFITILPCIVYAQSHRYERQRSAMSRIHSAATSDAPIQPTDSWLYTHSGDSLYINGSVDARI